MPDVLGWRVVVEVDPVDAELVADALFGAGALGIEERSVAGLVTLLAGMPDERSARAVAADHRGARVEAVLDDRWADEWRAWAKPVSAGGVLVQPAWLPVEPGDAATADHVVTLDPGRAFGSGSHESTRLALEELLARTPRGARVLDVGCGSGVLAVAVAVVRAAHAVAVDIDPHAVEVTRENADRNGVAQLVDASDTPIAEIDGPFDVVVANILAVTLRELAPELARLVAPDGCVVLSGMLAEQVASVDDACTAAGLRPVDEAAEGDWRARVYTVT